MTRLDLIISRVGGLSLTVFVRVRTHTGYSDPRRAFVDTGASYSVLALPRFPGMVYQPGPEVTIGRMELPECTFRAMQTTVTIQLEGKSNVRSPWITIPAWLVPEAEKVPNLIGLHGLFEEADLHLLLRKSQAYIEFP